MRDDDRPSYEEVFGKDLDKAVRESAVLQSGDRRFRLRWADNEPAIPRESVIYFRTVRTGLLTPGRFVVCRRAGELVVRRILRRFVRSREVFLVVRAEAQPSPEPPAPAQSVLGIVTRVEHGGRSWDPSGPPWKWAIQAWWARLFPSRASKPKVDMGSSFKELS